MEGLWNMTANQHHMANTSQMNNIKFLSLLLLAGLFSLQLQAQRTIEGVVVNTSHKALKGALVKIKGTATGAITSDKGKFTLQLPAEDSILVVSNVGFLTQQVTVGAKVQFVRVTLTPAGQLNEITVTDLRKDKSKSNGAVAAPVAEASTYNNNFAAALYGKAAGVKITTAPNGATSQANIRIRGVATTTPYYEPNSESYGAIKENELQLVNDQPLSTFSIDVDRASYSNVRRYLNGGNLPPVDAVRIEELINYFDYHYKNPVGKDPVAIYTDMATCPWDTTHQLVRIALKGKEIPQDQLPPANLVFLIDVSGSMSDFNKLPLIKQAMTALVQQLREKDRIAIVTYAGSASVALRSTAGSDKTKILDAINQLQAGGSTAGESGINLAYETATKSFMKNGNNRIILATDGDFNVGVSSENELEKLVETKRGGGIYLSVLGFGMGNYKDSKLEVLADKGNGNYAYIDNFEEARRTFVTEFGSTLFTVAKDVKLQVEFNPQYVQSYRLVGYENRLLENKDFNDDKKDAGDMGVGHTVTALYEIVPAGSTPKGKPLVDSLKYQRNVAANNYSGEVLTVKLRYKQPKEDESQLLSQVLPWKIQDISNAPEDFRLATAVAEFGLLLRNSEHKGQANYTSVLTLAKGAKGEDEEGYRAEFIQLVKQASVLKNEIAGN
jgi:Ca-activated chloride channel family protein